jgi:hypothetical protein
MAGYGRKAFRSRTTPQRIRPEGEAGVWGSGPLINGKGERKSFIAAGETACIKKGVQIPNNALTKAPASTINNAAKNQDATSESIRSLPICQLW